MVLSKRLISLAIILIFSTGFCQVYAQEGKASIKKRVAVFQFEDKTRNKHMWWTGETVGRGMADMLITALVKSGKYRVLERNSLDKIMKEQDLGLRGAVTQQSAAKAGKLLGVQLAIIGAVTEYGVKRSSVGGSINTNKLFVKSLGVRKSKVTVGIDLRFVNTTTGEIIASETVRKEKKKAGLKVGTTEFRFRSQNDFDKSLIGKVTREAIKEMLKKIDRQMVKMPWEAKIIRVTGNTVYINSGAEAGVNVGDVLAVYSKGEELIDPDTGLSLGAEEERIGTISVVTNNLGNGKASKARIVSGSGMKKGDLIRIK